MGRKGKKKSTTKEKWNRVKERRRNIIIQIAEQKFIEKGYAQEYLIEEIAQDAGMTKATIYNYFESKDDLFVAVVSRTFRILYQILEKYMQQPGVEYELRSLGDAYLTFVEEYERQAALFESPQLSLVISRILKKMENKESLTESEREFMTHQMKIQELMTDVITTTMKNAGVENKVDTFSVIMALSTLGSSIRELVIRGRRGEQAADRTREYLSVLFNIIDKGLKHYDTK